MLTRDKVVELLREQRETLSAEFGVGRVGLFGSFAKGQPGETSDVDLLVEFDRPIGFRFMELADFLEQVLQRKVDLLTPAGLRSIRHRHIAADISASVIYV